MKLRIQLSLLNIHGSSASLEGGDLDSLTVSESNSDQCPKKRCLDAAKALREAATRFEMLAKEDDPYKCTVQDKINRASIKA